MLSLGVSARDRSYFDIAVPAALEGVFMILLASADLIMVGTLGPAAIAAVSIFLQPRLVLLTFSRSVASAVTLLTAEKFGAGKNAEIARLLRQALFCCIFFLGALHIVFYFFLDELLVLMGASLDYMEQARAYAGVSTVGVFISSMSLILQAVQLGKGETEIIMKTNFAGNLVNVGCNFLLIFGLGPFPALGVRGAAIGTVVGAAVILLATLRNIRKEGLFEDSFLEVPTGAFFREFIPVSASVFCEMGAERIGMVLYARMVADLGMVPFAVHSICCNICDIYYDFVLGAGKASMVLAGQARGAKDKQQWRSYNRIGLKWTLCFAAASACVTAVFKEELFAFYSKDPQALALGASVMLLVALMVLPQSLAIVTAGILRGSGKTKLVAGYSFVLITVLRPIVTASFIYVLGLGLMGAWLAMLLDQMTRTVCYGWHIYRLSLGD